MRADSGPVEGVCLSKNLDLKALFGDVFERFAPGVRLLSPEEVEDPSRIRFALAWKPEDDAFTPYGNLALVSSIAAGVDSLLSCPSLPPDVAVTRLRDPDQGALMAGFAAWHVIWHHRNMGAFLEAQAASEWLGVGRYAGFSAPRTCTVGVLGYGLMGKAVVRGVAALGFPVVAALRKPRDEAPPPGVRFELGANAIRDTAAESRILINVLPLTEETRDVLDGKLFSVMPEGSVLVQLGRGDHLVDADLDAALDSGRLSAASLDVFRQEPLPPEHHWWRDPRILITPHKASDSSPRLVAEQVAAAVKDVLAGRMPETAVCREDGY